MTPLAAILALLLPALLGTAAVVAAHRGESSVHAPGFAASAIGAGIAIGAFATTLVLRALALASVPYGFAATVVPVAVLAAGDHVLIWQRPGIQYDTATQRLRFDNGVELGARLVVSDRGAALFAVL